MKIERPNWLILDKKVKAGGLKSYELLALNKWFNKSVEPVNKMLREGIEVELDNNLRDGPLNTIAYKIGEKLTPSSHTAILINIEPIKDTAEDVLREFLNSDDAMRVQNVSWLNRAQKVLGDK